MASRSGQRSVTKQDRATAVKREIMASKSSVRITPGMRRAVKPDRQKKG